MNNTDNLCCKGAGTLQFLSMVFPGYKVRSKGVCFMVNSNIGCRSHTLAIVETSASIWNSTRKYTCIMEKTANSVRSGDASETFFL